MNDGEQLWTAAAQLLREQVSDAVWLSTFQDVRALESSSGGLHLLVPSATVRERITTRYLPLVQDALREAGAHGTELVLDVNLAPGPDSHGAFPTADAMAPTSVMDEVSANPLHDARADHAVNGVRHAAPVTAAGLNPRYTFETFVIGPSNQFALAAALRGRRDARRARTTRCSSTAPPASARPTCSTPSATTSTRTTATTRCGTSPPRPS